MIRSVLMLAPEAPYPLHGGGAYRTASLLHYFARFAQVDLILISESGQPALLPAGLVRSQTVIPLPAHSRRTAARYLRNAGRILRGVPPLIDRLGGLGSLVSEAVKGRSYDLGVVEHFWCAPYLDQIAPACTRTVLDLHNIESVLHGRCASVEGRLVGAGHMRFARMYRKLETAWFPRYSLLLAASDADAAQVLDIAPGSTVGVYPNALPEMRNATVTEQPWIVFSGNFEYHPNIDAVRFLVGDMWPKIRAAAPHLRLRLVGRGDRFLRGLLPPNSGIDTTGPLEETMPEIAAAQVVVAPLRTGSGTRIKILEGWAAGRAVVATPLAAEGLEVQDGRNIVLAADADAFTSAILRLTNDQIGRQRLGEFGRHTFEERYTWSAAREQLDRILQSIY